MHNLLMTYLTAEVVLQLALFFTNLYLKEDSIILFFSFRDLIIEITSVCSLCYITGTS